MPLEERTLVQRGGQLGKVPKESFLRKFYCIFPFFAGFAVFSLVTDLKVINVSLNIKKPFKNRYAYMASVMDVMMTDVM
jgi:hypothetical protein